MPLSFCCRFTIKRGSIDPRAIRQSPTPSPEESPDTQSPTPSPEESPDIPDISLEKPTKETSNNDDSWFDNNKNWFIPVIAVVGVVILLTSIIVCAKFRFIT